MLLIALAGAALAVTWNPCAVIGGVMLLPIPTVLLFEQGRAIRPGSSRAARTSSILLFLIGGFAFIALGMSIGEMAMHGSFPPWKFALPFLAVGAISCWAAWLNRRWSQQLTDFESQDGRPEPPSSLTSRFGLPLAPIVCAAALGAYFIATEPPQFAEHVSRDLAPVDLPAGAVDVSYCLFVRGTVAYEFTISEQEFVQWAEGGIGSSESRGANVPVKPVNGAYSILRYSFFADELQEPNEAVVTDGLYYEWTKEDRGVYAAFDRKTGRAYYHAHFH